MASGRRRSSGATADGWMRAGGLILFGMSQQSRPGDSDMTGLYAAVLIVEVIVILGLYWLGRHFG